MEIKTIGIIGTGQMGTGIAQVGASCGYKIILFDQTAEFCERAISKIQTGLNKRVAAQRITVKEADNTMRNLIPATTIGNMNECDMVIETAVEVLESKQAIFTQLDRICRSDTLFCTNTSSLSITQVMKQISHPERCAGMHFFFPVTSMKLVEIIRGKDTSDQTVASIRTVADKMKKTAVECRTDSPGFIVNRCLFAFLMEAVHCYDDGVASLEDIDTAIRLGLNHPMGPFALMDMSGMDTFVHIAKTLQTLPVTSWDVSQSAQALFDEGNFGQKTGEGWYKYENKF